MPFLVFGKAKVLWENWAQLQLSDCNVFFDPYNLCLGHSFTYLEQVAEIPLQGEKGGGLLCFLLLFMTTCKEKVTRSINFRVKYSLYLFQIAPVLT